MAKFKELILEKDTIFDESIEVENNITCRVGPMKDKVILDACCGGRMFWFNKKHPRALYIDIRKEDAGIIKELPKFEVHPDIIMDFRKMDFPDDSFKLVVWDPPHLLGLSERGWPAKKYGSLRAESWQGDIKKGFDECWRVLENYGVLVFKWSDGNGKKSIPTKDILKLIKRDPLFGHTVGSKEHTHWFVFMKFPDVKNKEVKAGNADDGIPPNNKLLGILPTILWQNLKN